MCTTDWLQIWNLFQSHHLDTDLNERHCILAKVQVTVMEWVEVMALELEMEVMALELELEVLVWAAEAV